MKIALVLSNDWSIKYGGGSEYQAQLLLTALNTFNSANTFYICRYIDNNYDHGEINLVQIKRRSKKYPLFTDTANLYKTLRDINPDVIYQRIACAYTGVCAYYARKFGKKMIWHVSHDEDARGFRFKFSRGLLFRYIDEKILHYGIKNTTYIIGQTQHQNDLLKKNFGRKCDNIVPNFHPEPKNKIEKKEPIKIVWVANIKRFRQRNRNYSNTCRNVE